MGEKEYISREEIIKRFKARLSASHPGSISEAYYKACLDVLESQPAADVRPVKRGKWTLNKDGSGTCSECGFVQNSCWDLDNWDNFCHHCGADMRTEAE
jgi:hypothetical protein